MHKNSIDVDGFGTFTHEGRSHRWKAMVSVDGIGEPLELTINGTPSGPDERQVETVRATLRHWHEIIDQAAPELADLLTESELPVPAAVWDAFTITGIDVHALSYDPHAAHALVLLAHNDYPDEFWPAIDVVAGRVAEVLSGT